MLSSFFIYFSHISTFNILNIKLKSISNVELIGIVKMWRLGCSKLKGCTAGLNTKTFVLQISAERLSAWWHSLSITQLTSRRFPQILGIFSSRVSHLTEMQPEISSATFTGAMISVYRTNTMHLLTISFTLSYV